MKWSTFFGFLGLAALICQAGVFGAAAQSPQLSDLRSNAKSPQWVAQAGEMPVDYVQVRTFGEVGVPYLTDTNHINSLKALVTNPGYLPGNLDQIYVVENQGQRMLGYTPNGANIFEIGTAGLYGLLNDPVDAAVDPNGNLWLLTTSVIWVYDPAGNYLFQVPDQVWNLPDNNPLHLNWAAGIDFIHNGPGDDYVLITESRQQSVKYFHVDLTTTPYSLEHIATVGGFVYPMQVEAINNRFYVADNSQPPVIWECTLASPYPCIVFDGGEWGSGDHQLMSADGLAVDETYLYITDKDNQRVKRCALASGDCVADFITPADSILVDRPVDVARNSDGTLLVGSSGSMTVLKFNADGTLFTPTMQIGTPYEPYFVDEIHYYGPAGVEVDAQGNAYIIERQGNRLIKVNDRGEQQWAFGVAGVEGGDTSHLSWPEGSPAVDSLGRVYVASHGSRVMVLNPNGTYYGMIYYNEPDPGALSFACSVAIDAQDDIYVSDCSKNVVKVYGLNLAYKYTIGSASPSSPPPLDDDHFWGPKGIDFADTNTFYLADGYNSRVERCTRPNSTSQTWSCQQFAGMPRMNNGPIRNPADVAVDPAGRVYVMNLWDSGFSVFSPTGAPIAQVGYGMLTGDAEMNYSSGLTVDAQGSVYVADRHSAVVRKYVPVTGTTEFVSQAGGGVMAVAKTGNYAYVIDSAFLHVLDLTMTPPTEVGRSDLLTDTALDIVISGGYAYASAESGWVSIFDLSNPAHPSLVRSFPTTTSPVIDIDVWGSKLYAAAEGHGLLIYDLSDPEYPVLLGQKQQHEDVTSVALVSTSAGLTAFVTARDGGTDGWLCALDVDDPGSIILLDELDTPGSAESLAVQGDIVIVADGSDINTAYGLRMVNAADPENLSEIGNLEGYYAWRVEISGNFAYMLDSSQRVHSVVISTPSSPTLADTLASFADTRALLPTGSSLLVADRSNGLRRISISDPTNMSELPGWFNAPGVSQWAQLQNGYVYQAAGYKGLQVIDARDPLNLSVTGHLDLPGNTSFLKVDAGYAFTVNNSKGMNILRVTNPASPQWIYGDSSVSVENLDVVNQTAYVVSMDWAMRLLDVSNPAEPQDTGIYTHPIRNLMFVKVEENATNQILAYLLLSEYDDVEYHPPMLQVLDVTDPANIGVYGSMDVNCRNRPESFDVLDNIIYLPCNQFWGNLIVMIDAANPSALIDLGSFNQAHAVRSVKVAPMDDKLYAYISVYQDGMVVADVTDPGNPFLAGQIDLPGDVRGMSVEDNLVAVATGDAGLFMTWFAPQTNAVTGNNDTLTTQFDHTTYTFAADSLEDQARLIHTPVYEGNTPAAPAGLAGIGHAFITTALDFGNDSAVEPINPYTLEIPYAQVDLGSVLESTLKLYYWSGTAWVEEPGVLNQNLNRITAYPGHFSTWRVMGVPYYWTYLPTVKR